jgi:hypothetical protein
MVGKKCVVIIGMLILLPAFSLWAQTPGPDAALGEKLVRALFANPAAVKMSKAFQTVHQGKALQREEAARSTKGIDLQDYRLSDFKVTREANILVVTYTFTGQSTLEGKKMGTGPAPRLSVFIDTGKEWQWLAHGNFSAVQ